MKYLLAVLLPLLTCLGAFAIESETIDRLERFNPRHAEEILAARDTLDGFPLECYDFVLDYASDRDLAVFNAEFLLENQRLALKTRSYPFAGNIPDVEFLHFVLPPRISQEPFEPWRAQFFDELKPLVEDAQTIEEAILLINLWCAEQMSFQQTNGRDQAPLTTIKRGRGRCEEMMILFIAAAKAVGIPSRPASAPFWNFTDNNHAWTEVWTPDGWQFLGSGEPANRLNQSWFTRTTQRATLVTARAYGEYDAPNTLRIKDRASLIATTRYYTTPYPVHIRVEDEDGDPLSEATVTLYAASYGGLFPLTTLETGEDGLASLELGPGSVFVTASHEDRTGRAVLVHMNGESDIVLRCSEDKRWDEDFVLQFPPVPQTSPVSDAPEVLDRFPQRRELASLRLKNRMCGYRKPREFLEHYDLFPDHDESPDELKKRRNDYLELCDDLAGAAEDYLALLNQYPPGSVESRVLIELISHWDTKELVEIPDRDNIDELVGILVAGRNRFALPDTLWRAGVLKPTFSSERTPQNGWYRRFYEMVKPLARDSLTETAMAVTDWVDDRIEIDQELVYSYFTGTMNPLQLLDMKYVSELSRLVLIDKACVFLGVPTRWVGHLQYNDGADWVAFGQDEEETPKTPQTFTLSLQIDGETVKPQPFRNYLLMVLDKDGDFHYTYFDDKETGERTTVEYWPEPESQYFVSASVRNANGDAHIRLIPLDANTSEVVVSIDTPKEYIEANQSGLALPERIRNELTEKEPWFVVVFHENDSETQVRLRNEMDQYRTKLAESGIRQLFYTVSGGSRSPVVEDDGQIIRMSGASPFEGEFALEDYPFTFVIDREGTQILSTSGLRIGLMDLVLRMLKE